MNLLKTSKIPGNSFILDARPELENVFNPRIKRPPIALILDHPRGENDQSIKILAINLG